VVHIGGNCAVMFMEPMLLEKLGWCLTSPGLECDF